MRISCGRVLAASAAALILLSGCNRVLGPTKVDANWHVSDSLHFSLHARPGTFADESASTLGQVLDDQYEVTQRLLNVSYDGRISAFLYDSVSDADGFSDRSGTAYPDTAAFKAVATPPLDADLFALVSHEANHVIFVGALGRSGTSFMNEGLASALISERFHQMGAHFYHQWIRMHRAQLVPLGTLVNDSEWPHAAQSTAYSEAASFVAYLLESSGPAKVRELYYARSSEYGARFAQVYGSTLEDAEAAWLAFCDAAP